MESVQAYVTRVSEGAEPILETKVIRAKKKRDYTNTLLHEIEHALGHDEDVVIDLFSSGHGTVSFSIRITKRE